MTRGPWIQTHLGGQFFPLDPQPEDIEIIDIAHALSNQCRFSGHCNVFYSVAQHSCIVSANLPADLQLVGLLHDAAEAYMVDIPRPYKPYLIGLAEIEERINLAIAEKFRLPYPWPEAVKDIDARILLDEYSALMGPPPADWGIGVEPLGVPIEPCVPVAARYRFLSRFNNLLGSV